MTDHRNADGQRPHENEVAVTIESAETSGAELDRLREDLTEATNRALRAQADLENFRKRSQREVEEERRYANLPLLRDLLPVLDNISRAVEAAGKSPEAESFITGFRMVGKQLDDTLAKYGCLKIEAAGQPFDPHLHQAISQQPSKDVPANTVLYVAQDGYKLYDRVVRPAQVIVSVDG